jgi:hypothetical protein
MTKSFLGLSKPDFVLWPLEVWLGRKLNSRQWQPTRVALVPQLRDYGKPLAEVSLIFRLVWNPADDSG